MGLIKWHSLYSVNVAELDEEHKKLISLINRMYDAMKAGTAKEALHPVLTELLDYTAYHFRTEEEFLRQQGYLEYEAHKQIHAELTKRVQVMKDDLDRGDFPAAMDVMLFLSNWLNVHILEVDKKYGPYLNSKGVT
jgi:hemerythrin